ncbi:hypothetical protein U6A24_09920 [Aquimarina gracilis]|uniref:Chemoreceptor-like protein with four helix bundle sensory module n=1 Tax=Aquimarina gracilis TaxID=874422 RepID=A0ABU5ZUM5_9FLAO|nr:hypothetical protein [Aquimarina gracilis]MEB3345779.1 hypothetical protein [Aquimarina gracilis]
MSNKQKDLSNLTERNVFSLFLVMFIFVGIPILLGILGLYTHFTKKIDSYSGLPKYVGYQKECGDVIKYNNCLQVLINNDTIRALLSDKEVESYLGLISFSDEELNKKLDSLSAKPSDHNMLLREMAIKEEKYNRLYRVQNHINSVRLKYSNNTVKELYINNQKIVSYQSSLWWGVLSLSTGCLFLFVFLRFLK